jgi:collagen type I/II/III/V/XI/XXIV/XXVII alpha
MTTFNETGTIQTETISTSGLYNFTVDGAQGGLSQHFTLTGGMGAAVSGDINLTAGTVLEIVVGDAGTSAFYGGGGGGGSYIIETFNGTSPVNDILAVAGGGGGGSSNGFGGGAMAAPTGGPGGHGGTGGAAGAPGTGVYDGGGGGGFTGGAGASTGSVGGTGTTTETSFAGGAAGVTPQNGSGAGGFGGGGGGGYSGGGGGGGYGGGGGGGAFTAGANGGGGGGSYLAASVTGGSETASTKTGNGLVSIDLACFCAGTHILTPHGDVAVESLQVGDTVLTVRADGPATRRVIWTGQRSIDITRHATPDLIRPVRILAGAFGPGLPERDLRLSPSHAVYVDGALIEVFRLVNGVSVVRERATNHVTYHHIELEAHDIVLAEGLASESFLDTGNRDMFEGQPGAMQLHPHFSAPPHAPFCAPMLGEGALLEAVRARLHQRVEMFRRAA